MAKYIRKEQFTQTDTDYSMCKDIWIAISCHSIHYVSHPIHCPLATNPNILQILFTSTLFAANTLVHNSLNTMKNEILKNVCSMYLLLALPTKGN